MMRTVDVTGKPNDCCNDDGNLEIRQPNEIVRDNITVRVCKVCGCRHFELIADRGDYDARGLGLSG